jgi:hypothetical protein
MRLIFLIVLIFVTANASAVIHKRTEYFLDLELSKKTFLITCSGGPQDDNSILSFHLMDGDTYYNFYYRRVRTVKDCHKLKIEYMDMLKEHDTVRIVANHPTESEMSVSEAKAESAPFNKARKIIFGPFIRLQTGNKCKDYFSKDCDLPKNYWGGVNPET